MERIIKLLLGAIFTMVVVIGPAYFIYGVVGSRPPLNDVGLYSVISVCSYVIGITFKA